MTRLLPWALPVGVGAILLHRLGVPAADLATYGLYFAGCVVLPGVLLLRALWRSTGNHAEDIGLGVAVGLAYELPGWAVFTALGWQRGLVAWPLLLVAAFAAVPRLRRYWRIADPAPLPVAWSWAVAVLATVSILLTPLWMMGAHVPPGEGGAFHPDLLYHLSMVHELVRAVPPELPQVAGEPLEYHWFADAHLAAAVDITGVDAATVLYRLWLLPVWFAGLLVFAALARHVSRVWWTGPLAVVLTAFTQYVAIWSIQAGRVSSPFGLLSPTQTYGVVVGTVAAMVLLDVLVRRRVPPRAWILLGALALLAGGAKPTALPLLLGGTGVAAAYLLVRDRRLPWRAIAAGGLLLVTGVVTTLTVAGSTAGSHLQLFGSIRWLLGYTSATGDDRRVLSDDWIVAPLAGGDTVAALGAWVVVGTVVVSQLGMLVGFGVLLARSSRRDPVMWWLAGATLAGWLGYLVLAHPSASEAYFIRSAAPFAAATACRLLADSLRGRGRRVAVRTGAVGLGLGVVLLAVPHLARTSGRGTKQDHIALLGYPMLVLAVLTGLVVVGWRVLRRRRPDLRGLGIAVTVLAVTGMTLPWIAVEAERIVASGNYPARAIRVAEYAVHPDEQRAAAWLAASSAPADEVVTNTACRPARRQPPGCDARGYVVSGIAGRRTLLEGWGYTQQAHARHGEGGLRYTEVPSPWPDRAGLVRSLFTAPTPELVDLLRTEHGVRWVYADRLAGPVPGRLRELAVLRHAEPTVEIYELR